MTTKDVEYTDKERDIARVRDLMIEEGLDKTTAARYALTAAHRPRKAFVEHLSDGGLTKIDGKIVIVHAEATQEA